MEQGRGGQGELHGGRRRDGRTTLASSGMGSWGVGTTYGIPSSFVGWARTDPLASLPTRGKHRPPRRRANPPQPPPRRHHTSVLPPHLVPPLAPRLAQQCAGLRWRPTPPSSPRSPSLGRRIPPPILARLPLPSGGVCREEGEGLAVREGPTRRTSRASVAPDPAQAASRAGCSFMRAASWRRMIRSSLAGSDWATHLSKSVSWLLRIRKCMRDA